MASFHVSSTASGKSLIIDEYKAHTNQTYGNPDEDFFAHLVSTNQELNIGLEIDSRKMNDMSSSVIYTPLGLSASLTMENYENIMVLAPSVLYYPTDNANMARLFGFANQDVITPTSTSGTINIFTSTEPPNMKSNSSLFKESL